MDEEDLTTFDYATYPLVELMTHENYSAKAMVTVAALLQMKTPELERLNSYVLEGKHNG